MVMENWASVREAAAKGEGPSVSAFASSSSSQHATSASSSSSSVKDDHTSPPNKSPQVPQPLPPPITDISRIIDELQSGDERAVEHGLFSLMPLLDRSANLDDPAQEPLRALLRQRVNQLLETLVDTFASLYQASPSSPKGVTVMTQLHLLRATSHILEAVVGRPDLAAGVSSKTIAAYVRAMLPVRRLMPGLEELRAVFRYQSPLGKIRRLTDLMARHGSLILKRPSSIVGNHLDRSHLLVALLRETTAMLTRPLEPHFGYLLLQIARLNEAFVEWTEKKASGGGMGGMAVRNDEPPVPGDEDEALEAAQQEHLFERLNLDLLLYEVDRLCYELLQRNFEGQYETWVNSLVEHLETLLKSLMTYARLTGHHILEHFVLVRATLADSVPYRYVAGRLMLLSGGRLQMAGFGGQYWPPPRATERLSEVLSDVQQIQAMARHYEAVGREDQGQGQEELAMDLAMDRAMGFGGGGAMDEGIHFEVEEGGGGDEEDEEGYNGEDDLEEEDDDDMVEDGLLPQDRFRRGPQPAGAEADAAAAPVVEADGEDEETYEEEEDVEEDAECVASRQLLMRLVLGGHLGHRFGWATTALMALGEEGRQALQYHLPPPINDYGRPRAAVMAARANGYGDGPHQELLQFHN